MSVQSKNTKTTEKEYMKAGVGMNSKNQKRYKLDEELFEQIKEQIEQIQFGSVTIIIQDGRVVQVDQQKKIRLV